MSKAAGPHPKTKVLMGMHRKEVVRLYEQEHFTIEKIGRKTGVPARTVKMILTKSSHLRRRPARQVRDIDPEVMRPHKEVVIWLHKNEGYSIHQISLITGIKLMWVSEIIHLWGNFPKGKKPNMRGKREQVTKRLLRFYSLMEMNPEARAEEVRRLMDEKEVRVQGEVAQVKAAKSRGKREGVSGKVIESTIQIKGFGQDIHEWAKRVGVSDTVPDQIALLNEIKHFADRTLDLADVSIRQILKDKDERQKK